MANGHTGTRDMGGTDMPDGDPRRTRDGYARAGAETGQGMQARRWADYRCRMDHRNRAANASPKSAAADPQPTPAKSTATDMNTAPTETTTTDVAPTATAWTPGIGIHRQKGRNGEHQACYASGKSEAIG